MRCPLCNASPGHPCVEVRKTGQHGKHFGWVRGSNHAERIAAYQSETGAEHG